LAHFVNKLSRLRESLGVRATSQETAVVDSGNRGTTALLWGAFATARERGESDADLLGRFVLTRDEAAFRELVRRLGPTVFGVCRRLLGNTSDADDAFQTTFIVLARKAGTVQPPGRVAAWVYGVASLAARKLRQTRSRRQLREVAVSHPPDRPGSEREMDIELLPAVDEELGRLPENYRLPIVLCGLRGLTIAQAAHELGWPAGTVATRLSRGRTELRKRLAKRGIVLAAVAVSTGGWSELAAGVPPRLIEQTVAAAVGGTTPPAVAALTSEVITAMMWTPVRRLGASALLLSVLAGSALFANDVKAPLPNVASPVTATQVAPDSKPALDRVEWDRVGGLLRQESVRNAIGLSDDDYRTLAEFRKEKLAAAKKQLETGLQGANQPNGGRVQKTAGAPKGEDPINLIVADVLDQHLTTLRELDAEVAKKATAALKPAGVKRLKQIVLQAAGPRGLLDRVVIRDLQLTAEQEDKLAAVVGPARPPRFMVLPDAWLRKAAREQNVVMDTALKLLTAEQRKRWEDLVGEPIPTIDLLKAGPMSGDSIAELNGE
jgi:RNA polymerase sigma-70 factor (ECF subfamily)